MSSKRRNTKATTIAVLAAVLVGTVYYVLEKYPSLKQRARQLLDWNTGEKDEEMTTNNNTPVILLLPLEGELDPTLAVSSIDSASASTETMKSWLSSVRFFRF